MKPRPEPCDYTCEDAHAWATVVFRAPGLSRFGSMLYTRSLMQDRGDADLMLYFEQQRLYFGPAARVRADHWTRWREAFL